MDFDSPAAHYADNNGSLSVFAPTHVMESMPDPLDTSNSGDAVGSIEDFSSALAAALYVTNDNELDGAEAAQPEDSIGPQAVQAMDFDSPAAQFADNNGSLPAFPPTHVMDRNATMSGTALTQDNGNDSWATAMPKLQTSAQQGMGRSPGSCQDLAALNRVREFQLSIGSLKQVLREALEEISPGTKRQALPYRTRMYQGQTVLAR
jgi:hypothetical protein